MRWKQIIESEEEMKFYLREVERGDGQWLWQYGRSHDGGKIYWTTSTYKTAEGAVKAAQKVMMNPNYKSNINSAFFKNPIIADRLPITNLSNPYCMD